MSYIALYREWRPQTFSDMVGQEHITRTLRNAIRTGTFAHAYLLSGPRGTGKTSAAKVFAKAINCQQGRDGEPCNECAACKGITDGSIMDVVEIDAASNRGVDEIRDLRDQVKYAPTEVRHKVYIIDEVHMLTTEAFNALLKTLEEPPANVLFVLATTEPHRLPATILSRCQRFDFRRHTGPQIVDRLRYIADQKGIAVEDEGFWLIARAAEGGMRDALSLFDQAIAFGGERVTAGDVADMLGGIRTDALSRLAQHIAEKDTAQALRTIHELLNEGKDAAQLVHDLMGYFRELLLHKTVPDVAQGPERQEFDPAFRDTVERFTGAELSHILDLMNETLQQLKWQSQGRLLLEMLMIRACRSKPTDVQGLLDRIERLENALANVQMQRPSAVDAASAAPTVAPMVAKKPVIAENQPKRPISAQEKSATTSVPSVSAPVAAPVSMRAEARSGTYNPELTALIQSKWNVVLDLVKRRKITARAWLLDGEPVAVKGNKVIVAFKNQIHCDTIQKPVHKDVVDEVLSEILQGSYQLDALLQTEWQSLQEQQSVEPTEEQARAAEEETRSADTLIQGMIDLLGKDRVQVLD